MLSRDLADTGGMTDEVDLLRLSIAPVSCGSIVATWILAGDDFFGLVGGWLLTTSVAVLLLEDLAAHVGSRSLFNEVQFPNW